MAEYPLMFTLRDVVSGDGFLAGVTVSGRVLMVEEDDRDWWAYGVRPTAIADHGSTPQEAFHQFRNRYKTLLFDIANDSRDFASFKNEVERFYAQPNEEDERRWEAAFWNIRKGNTKVEEPFTALPKQSPERWATGITVLPLHEVQRFTASDNIPDTYACAAAA